VASADSQVNFFRVLFLSEDRLTGTRCRAGINDTTTGESVAVTRLSEIGPLRTWEGFVTGSKYMKYFRLWSRILHSYPLTTFTRCLYFKV
jgi:hypothetical protein